MNKLDIAKQLFEYDKKVGKDCLGIFYKDIPWDELPSKFHKYYRIKTQKIISMVRNLDE